MMFHLLKMVLDTHNIDRGLRMDYNLWSRVILPLTILIFIIYVIISSNREYKKIERKKLEAKNEMGTPVNKENVLPPFMENFEEFRSGTELAHETQESAEADVLMVTEQSEPVYEPVPDIKPIVPPSIPIDSPGRLSTKSMPATSLIDFSPQTYRRGIILAEILGRPKGLHRRT